MHNNYFFIKKLCPFLHRINIGGVITECFSQEKDELIIRINNQGEDFFIRATLKPHQTFLTFPDTFHRAKNNSIDLFNEIIGATISEIKEYHNERAFKISLSDHKLLFFKLYGNHANVILFQNNKFYKSFNQKLVADEEIIPELCDKDIIITEEIYDRNSGDLTKIVPTAGKAANQYWLQNEKDHSFHSLIDFVSLLDSSTDFYITSYQKNIILTLFKAGDVIYKTSNPIEACNLLYQAYIFTHQLEKEKNLLKAELLALIKKTNKYIEKAQERLQFLEKEARNEEFGHILMANLYNIQPKATQAELEDFYHNNTMVSIPLKKDLNPQQNAEYYYKKAKNEWKEKAHIKENIAAKHSKIIETEALLEKIDTLTNLKELRSLSKNSPKKRKEDPTVDELFRKISIENFTILIGKNASNNDLLTLKYAHKDDLWLHARNVSGSHVVIKNIPGQKIPKTVIERAAEIAAFHSKAKNDTLTPVMYTTKKFVRKLKGTAPGSVVVDKEEVIMVQPKDY